MSEEKNKEQPNHSLIVRKNDLVEGRYRLNSSFARRILYRAMAQVDPSNMDFKKVYKVKLNDLMGVSGIKMSDSYYQRVAEAVKLLQGQIAESWDFETKKYTVFSWFHKIEYEWGEGSVSVIFHEDMKPLLLNLIDSGNFTVANEKFLAIISSPYSDRIYGLLKQYQKIGSRIMTVEEIREKLKIEKKYPLFYDFRRYVLDTAKKEVGQKTDISFNYDLITKGRKVEAIRFTIESKEPSVTIENLEETEPRARTIFQRLKKHGVAEKTARELIADYDIERLEWHVKEYEQRKKAKKANGVGWLIQGIKEDYRNQTSMFEQEEAEKRKRAQAKRERQEQLSAEIDRLKKECDEYNHQSGEVFLAELPEEERGSLDQAFLKKYGAMPGMKGRFQKEGLSNPMVRTLYLIFLHEKYPNSGLKYQDYAKKKGARKEVLATLSD